MIISGVALRGVAVVDASIITQNLAIWIDANNADSYSGTGTAIADLSGNNRTQNLVTAGQFTVLDGVKCWDCTTGTNFITAAVTGPILPTSGFTYIAWARINASSATWRTLFRSMPNDHSLIVQVGTDNLGMFDNTIDGFFDSGYDVTDIEDVWVQYAVVGDSSGQTFYINGQSVGTTVQTAAGNSHYVTGGWINSQPFGYVANMFLYTVKLMPQQIQQNYYALQQRFVVPGNVTSDLVLYYDPNNPASYSGTGTIINSLASPNLAGTMSNITFTNPYFTYNGTSSQVSVADNALLEPGSGSWTMEAWVNQTVSGNDVVLGKFDPGGLSVDVSYSIRTIGTSYFAQVGSGSGSGSTLLVDSTSFTGTLNTWYQLIYVFTNGATKTLETFVNGASIGTVNHNLASVLNNSSPLYIGSYNGGEFSQWFHGRIGITRLYNTALTSAQVLQNFNANRSIYSL